MRKPIKAVSLVARLLPGLAPTDLNIQRNTQGGGTAHLLDEHAFGGFTLTGGDFEDDFVVYLQQHAGLQALFAQAAVNVDRGGGQKWFRCSRPGVPA